MKNSEGLQVSGFNTELKLKGFKAYEIECDSKVVRNYSRKDFYKICLNTGKNIIHYADKSFETNGPILFFGNPHIPYSWQTVSPKFAGYACLFSESFLKTGDRSESLQQSPFFKLDGTPLLNITNEQKEFIGTLFKKMIQEQETDYAFKDDLIRNYIHLVMHEALKMQPLEKISIAKNASSRITTLFFELLERQFPIDNNANSLQLRTAQDYAKGLSIHVNHLNRSIKEITGKPTTAHIAERIITEARALLQHTDWSIAEVAYALGFEYPTYFNNFFKKMTGTVPSSLRS